MSSTAGPRRGCGIAAPAALLWACAFAAGCAGDVGDINYVQPGYVKKADLTGRSWYYRRTVVDTPETGRGPVGTLGPWATIGMGDLFTIERVWFEVQEDYLIGRRDYEYIAGSETFEDPGGAEGYRGQPLVAFPITSHFDIQYDYRPDTGERFNTIRENTVDRPWYERAYIRVEWNRPQVLHNPFTWPVELSERDGQLGGTEYIDPNDADNPWRARLTPERGYLDFVTNHYAVPDLLTCYLDFDFSLYDITACGPGEIKVRHAFWAIEGDLAEENRTYAHLEYPDTVVLHQPNPDDPDPDPDHPEEILDPDTAEVVREPIFERFGFYRLERMTYDDRRGLTESGRLYRIIRFNIWQRSLDDEGREIPYRQRAVRPIVYHLNWDFPEELKPTAFSVADQWNQVFRETVALLQERDLAEVPDVFVLRENACNVLGLQAYLQAHPEVEQRVSDTLTRNLGPETLDNWCAATEYFSEQQSCRALGDDTPGCLADEDLFRWAQIGDPRYHMMVWIDQVVPAAFSGYGPMLADPISGRNVSSTAFVLGWTIDAAATRALEYIDYVNDELPLGTLLSGANLPPGFFAGTHDPRADHHAHGPLQYAAASASSPEDLQEIERRFRSLGSRFDEMMTPLENRAHFDERLARIAGTDLERTAVIRPEDLIVASRGAWRPGMPVDEDLWERASWSRKVLPLWDKQQNTRRFLEERTMCPVPLADLDGTLIGLAERLAGKPRAEKLLILRRAIFEAVMLHEIGHNVGLRHNFEGSYDALNYHRAFWDLEAQHGHGTREAEEAKERASQPEYKYSSIMDYHGRINADFRGLGHYDRAAVKFGYGQLLEVFEEDVPGGDAMRAWLRDNDYRDLLVDDTDGVGPAEPAYFPSVDAMYARDHVSFDWRVPLDRDEVSSLLEREVPYRFCSDEYAGVTPTCRRYDFGANQREVQRAAEVRYKNYFVFSNFRRQRLVLDPVAVQMRSLATFREILRTYQYFYYYRAKDTAFADTDSFADFAHATARGLNLMKEVLAMPGPDVYYRCVAEAGTPEEQVTYYPLDFIEYDPLEDPGAGVGPEGEACAMSEQVGLGLGQGFPMFFGFDEELYNWGFTYLGVYWDKLAAIFQLTYPLAWFPRENQGIDHRTYSVSLYRLYHPEVNDILLGLIELDRAALGSFLDPDAGVVVPEPKFPGGPPQTPQAPSARVAPALARNLQVSALVYAMALLTSPLDSTLDFAKHTRVVVKGAPDDFFDAAGYPDIAECELPEAGITYRAVPTAGANRDERMDVAYNLVHRCAERVTARQQARDELLIEQATLEGLPPGTPEHDEQQRLVEEAQSRFDSADARLRITEQVLLWMRQLNRVYEYGL